MVKEEIDHLKNRVDELEQRESFHEITLETLNQCLIDQQQQIEQLQNELAKLSVKLLNQTEESQVLQQHERPPHY